MVVAIAAIGFARSATSCAAFVFISRCARRYRRRLLCRSKPILLFITSTLLDTRLPVPRQRPLIFLATSAVL